MYLAPYAGLHFDVALLLNRKVFDKYGPDSGSESEDLYSKYDSFRRCKMGYQAGLNLGYKKLNLGIGYKGSILPFYKDNDVKVQTNDPVFSVGLNF